MTLFVLFYNFPHNLSFLFYGTLSSSNLTWQQPSLLLSLPFPLCYIYMRCFIKIRMRVCVCAHACLAVLCVCVPVCLVTHCSDTHLLASYNNGLPHRVHPLCSCPVLMQHTTELSPTFLLTRSHTDMSHSNRPATVPILLSTVRQHSLDTTASLYTFEVHRVYLVAHHYQIRGEALGQSY